MGFVKEMIAMSSISQTSATDGGSIEQPDQERGSISVWLEQLWTSVSQFFFHISFETGSFLLKLLLQLLSRPGKSGPHCALTQAKNLADIRC